MRTLQGLGGSYRSAWELAYPVTDELICLSVHSTLRHVPARHNHHNSTPGLGSATSAT